METEGAGAPLAVHQLPALLDRLHRALDARRSAIDALNVFPVPDGDTGTNMTLTLRAGLEALATCADAPADEVGRAVVRGAVRGARGNSGVILSQVIRAVVEVVTEQPHVDGSTYARALDRARALAYEAVAEPVEGTILTAIAAAATAATAAAEAGAPLSEVSARTLSATRAAVRRTPAQLDVLREAGVVDAGAHGFEVLVAAVHAQLTGQDVDVEVTEPSPAVPHRHSGGSPSPLEHRFEVQYLLDADASDAAPLRQRLEGLGDSVVVVAAGHLLNVHVHTDDVGAAIEEGLRWGRPSDIEVTHLGERIAARQAARSRLRLGVAAVLQGDGLVQLARERGVAVVDGTAGALPSVAELLDAVSTLDAQRLALLPGHRNVVAAADTAAEVAVAEGGRRIDVVASATSPPAVLAALAVLDPDADPDQVIAEMEAAAASVRTGEVVAAVRDASTPLGPVAAGQPLAVCEGEVVAVGADPLGALRALCQALTVADAEVATLIVGTGVDADERAAAVALVHERCGGDVEVLDGGQCPSRYWLGAE